MRMASWIQRAIGAGLIIVGAAAYGAGLARSVRQRVRELAALDRALHVLETEITYGYVPLPEACLQVGRSVDGYVAHLFNSAGKRLVQADRPPVNELWKELVGHWGSGSHLNGDDLAVLAALGATLGRSDAEDQARHLRLARERLLSTRRRLEENIDQQCRLRIYLGAGSGAVLAVLLV